jgi:hypothetical protein
VELHVSGAAHPFPPEPRHPGSQAWVVVLHTRPDVGPPQLVSVAHPHVSFARQAEPTPVAEQLVVCFGVHSTHLFVESHTSPLGQSGSFKQTTHACG